MDSITTASKQFCDLCGAPGEPAQLGVTDPDGHIAGEWQFQRCTNTGCGVYWLDPAPLEQDLWKTYVNYHTHTRKPSARLSGAMLSLSHRLLKILLMPAWMAAGLRKEMAYLRFMTLAHEPAGKILDVGCGAGRFLRRMRKHGWQVEGVDYDAQAARRVVERYGIQAHAGDLISCAFPDKSFDAITMSQTVEHLYDPRSTLAECLRVLKPGGLLVMTTPNVNSMGAAEFGPFWRGWEPPRHLHLFTPDSLQRLVQGAGFEVIETRTCSSGAAVIYRVSKTRQLSQDGKLSFARKLWLLAWSYYKELREHLQQTRLPYTGQDILIRARRPLL